jgi:nucleotide-binding universal stress UspA family protein
MGADYAYTVALPRQWGGVLGVSGGKAGGDEHDHQSVDERPGAPTDPELREWVESFEALVEESGAERAAEILAQLRAHAERKGIPLPFTANSDYVNTIP